MRKSSFAWFGRDKSGSGDFIAKKRHGRAPKKSSLNLEALTRRIRLCHGIGIADLPGLA
jgi:hypothetical protein